MNKKIRSLVYFKDYKEKYINLSENKEEWIPLFEIIEKEVDGIKDDIFVFSALLENSEDNINESLKEYQWGFSTDSFGNSTFSKMYSNGEKEIIFETGEYYDKYEYLIAYRTFDSDFDTQIEINPKLIWYNNLVKVKDGYIEPLSEDYKIKTKDNSVFILKEYLRDFLSSYGKICVIGYDNRRFFKQDLDIKKVYDTDTINNANCSLVINKCNSSDYNFYSCILGKIIIRPFSKPNHPHYAYLNPPKEIYEEFIVGIDENTGKEIFFTCNKNKLANDFKANPDTPCFLTPVYFKKQVLDKYTNNPAKYTIADDHIAYLDQWLIPYSINKEDKVTVWLGDLGRIPHNEQSYWKSCNIKPNGEMNKKFIKRQLNAEWTDVIREEKKLLQLIDHIDDLFVSRYGNHIFNELSEADIQIKDAFSIPTNNSVPIYQTFLMQLCKLTIERINKKLINDIVEDKDKLLGQDNKPLGSRLQLKVLLKEIKIISVDVLDDILKKIYDSRNKLAGHSGSFKEYNKVWKRNKEFKPDFISDAKSLLNDLNKALNQFYTELQYKFEK